MATKKRKDKDAREEAIIAAIQKASEVAKKASKAARKSAVLTEKARKAAASKAIAEVVAAAAATEAVIEAGRAAAAAASAAVEATEKVIIPCLTLTGKLNLTRELVAAAASSDAADLAASVAVFAALKAAMKATEAVVILKASSKPVEQAAAAVEAENIATIVKASEAVAKTAAEAAREASKAAKEAAKAITAFITEVTKKEAVSLAEEASNAAEKAAKAAEEALEAIKPAAKAELEKSQKKIEENKPKPSGVKIINPSDDSDWHLIKYYPKLNKEVKENFKKDRYVPDKLMAIQEAGPYQGKAGNVIGNLWHKFLADGIKGEEIKEEAYKKVADLLFEKLRKPEFGCIDLFDSNFKLYGFMRNEEQVYFWRGDADAIGWYYNDKRNQYEYVIVDWKVLGDVLNFWESTEAFGNYLHQCLVYAKLLQLHLDLDYLPSILIVPISSNNGKDINPGLFWDYPGECKSAIDERFSWSIKQPDNPPRKVLWTKDLFNALDAENDFSEKKLLKEGKLLKDLFAVGAKVKDLLKAFKFSGLTIENLNED